MPTNRFLQYVKVHTTSDPTSPTHPTTPRQFDLANKLAEEMKALGLSDVRVDEHCYVYAAIPATPGCEKAHAIGFIAHMDTTDDASGENVRPILHENYDGGDVYLPGSGDTIHVAEFPFLADLKGQTLITTDGTTLLGADDKAGIAEIVTMAERLLAEKRPHGKICIAFTPDEEVGQGADLFDVEGFGATSATRWTAARSTRSTMRTSMQQPPLSRCTAVGASRFRQEQDEERHEHLPWSSMLRCPPATGPSIPRDMRGSIT